jgi:hypothetical protein|tara:strand:- start:86 stop:886 length:801 start_codon:yes stop_codon:yes gene_type:complete
MSFNDEILQKYMATFLGYGNEKGNILFVGLEEGIGVKESFLKQNHQLGFNEINKKLIHWNKRGKKVLEDCREFHLLFDKQWHLNPSKLIDIQSTWKKIILALLTFAGKTTNFRDILYYQKEKFCRFDSNHALIELRPLPSKKLKGDLWFYPEFSQLPFLVSKPVYEKYITEKRVNYIRNFINRTNFKAVVFLSKSDAALSIWETIIDDRFENIGTDFLVKNLNGKLFISTYHPSTQFFKKKLSKSGSLENVYLTLGSYLNEKISRK